MKDNDRVDQRKPIPILITLRNIEWAENEILHFVIVYIFDNMLQ